MAHDHPELFEVLRDCPLFRDEVKTFREVTGFPLVLAPASSEDMMNLSVARAKRAANGRMPAPCWRCLMKALTAMRWTPASGKPSRNGQRVAYCRKGLAAVAVPVWMDGQHVATLAGGWTWMGDGTPPFCQKTTRSDCPLSRKLVRRGTSKRFSDRGVSTTSHLGFHGVGRWVARLAAQLGENLPNLLQYTRGKEPMAVVKARAYVEANFAAPLHTAQMSEHVSLCETHFCRVFKNATGFTFSDYVAHRRIEEAKRLLRAGPARRIREVALATGFQTIFHFNHMFRKLVGLSPTVWGSRRRRRPIR